ncbi:MAG TPA: zinc ribbon domain-containing protein [Actinomycetota bacterium]|jgi:putative FmdB family regulatory protein|nr:zinc ribbon domain-containing protein [Actinomycetota bacterium]
MAVYEYICLGCEQPFEQRRSMDAAVDTALACPSCGSDRVRRRFSVFGTGGTSPIPSGPAPSNGGGCCGGGACACGH